MDRFSAKSPCRLCDGTRGVGTDGAHHLCLARAERGLPTPSLGHNCTRCEGRGYFDKATTSRSPVFSDPYSLERHMRARLVDCPYCDGTGRA